MEDGLPQMVKNLENWINHYKNPEHLPAIKGCLEGLSFYLNKADMKLEANLVAVHSRACMSCEKVIRKRDIKSCHILPCDQDNTHIICSDKCFQDFIALYSENNILNWKYVKCPTCGTDIPRSSIEKAYGGEEEFKKIIREAEDARVPHYPCELCLAEQKITDFVTLNCDHRYCKSCMEMYLTTYIMEGKVTPEDLKCFQCGGHIDFNIIKENISKKTLFMLEKFLIRNWKPDDLNGRIFYVCQGPDCEYRCILDANAEEIECENCKLKCCPLCYKDPHVGKTCEENEKELERNKENQMMEEMVKSMGFQKCPHCGAMSEKIQGCNFMTCGSPECKAKRYFCYLCGCVLQTSDHFTHFFNKPFEGECFNKNNRLNKA